MKLYFGATVLYDPKLQQSPEGREGQQLLETYFKDAEAITKTSDDVFLWISRGFFTGDNAIISADICTPDAKTVVGTPISLPQLRDPQNQRHQEFFGFLYRQVEKRSEFIRQAAKEKFLAAKNQLK